MIPSICGVKTYSNRIRLLYYRAHPLNLNNESYSMVPDVGDHRLVPGVSAHRLLAPLRWGNTRGASFRGAHLSSSHSGVHELRAFPHHNIHENLHVKNVESHGDHDCDRMQPSNLHRLHYHFNFHVHILHASGDRYDICHAFSLSRANAYDHCDISLSHACVNLQGGSNSRGGDDLISLKVSLHHVVDEFYVKEQIHGKFGNLLLFHVLHLYVGPGNDNLCASNLTFVSYHPISDLNREAFFPA